MNKLQNSKSVIDEWFLLHPAFEISSEKFIEHPLKKEMMTFNIVFTDYERKQRNNDIKYNITAFENEIGECKLIVDALFYTGINEDIDREKEIEGYILSVKNIANSKEALVRVSRIFTEDEMADFSKVMDILTHEGINSLIF